MSKKKILIMYSTEVPTEDHVRRVKGICGDRDVVVVRSESEAVRAAPDAEIILGHRYLWQTIPYAKKLKWIQSSAAGADYLNVSELQVSHPVLTRAPLFSHEIAWHALSMGMALSRGLPASVFLKDKEQWKRDVLPCIPKVAMVFGTGLIGCALGEKLRGLGLQVIGVNRSGGDQVAPWDELISSSGNWKDYLEKTDFFFFCAPHDVTTHRIIDADCLGRLPDSAIIVSISNSRIFDFSALVSEIKQNRIAVALDSLDASHDSDIDPLLEQANIIITPKVSSFCPDRQKRFECFVEDQINRYITNKPLLHEVAY